MKKIMMKSKLRSNLVIKNIVILLAIISTWALVSCDDSTDADPAKDPAKTAISGTLSYSAITGDTGTAITAVSPAWADAGEGQTVTYSINPALPEGLGINADTGEISGNPNAPVSGNFVVTASGSGEFGGSISSAEFAITITGNTVAYYVYSDAAGITTTTVADGFTFYPGYEGSMTAAEQATGGANSTTNYLSLTGGGGGWAAGGWGRTSFTDLSAYNALYFWAKSDAATSIKFGIEDPTGTDVSRTITNTWTEYKISFADLEVASPSTIGTIKYVLSGTSDVVNIDEIRLDNFNFTPITGNVSYSNISVTAGTALTTEEGSPTWIGAASGQVVRYVLDLTPPLPAGLTIDTATGIIGGTPTAAQGAINYTLRAYAEGDYSGVIAAGVFTIEVMGAPITGSVSYSNITATTGTEIGVAFPMWTNQGIGQNYIFSTDPKLPAGITINRETGRISGSPYRPQSATGYKVIVSGGDGFSGSFDSPEFTIEITGNPVAIPNYYFYSDAAGISPTIETDGFTFYPGYEGTMTAPEQATGGADSTDKYLSLTGGGGGWAAGGWNQADIAGGKMDFDASLYNTLFFWAKSDAATIVKFGIEDESASGGNPEIERTIDNTWKKYSISFAELEVVAPDKMEVLKYILSPSTAIVHVDEIYLGNAVDISGTLSYSAITGDTGTPIQPVSPAWSDAGAGQTVSYSINPALPSGLDINADTGEISGNPNAPVSGNFVVTASGSGEFGGSISSAEFAITITGNTVAYYVYSDAAGITTTTVADGFTFYPGYEGSMTAVEQATGGANSTTNYLLLTGASGGWAAGGWGRSTFTDLSAYNALYFWAKSDAATSIKFAIQDPSGTEIHRTITNTWAEYKISFADLEVTNPSAIDTIKYALSGTSDVVNIDEIRLDNFNFTPITGNVSYSNISVTAGTALTTEEGSPTWIGAASGQVVRYVLDPNPPLPVGLTIDTATGIISGTPTVAQGAIGYTLRAYAEGDYSGVIAAGVFTITVQ